VNQVLHSAAESTDHGWLIGVATVIFVLLFVSYTVWAFSSRSREYLEEAAQLPFDDDDEDE